VVAGHAFLRDRWRRLARQFTPGLLGYFGRSVLCSQQLFEVVAARRTHMDGALFQDASRDLWQLSVGYLAETQLNPVVLTLGIVRNWWHAQVFEGRVKLAVRQAARTRDDLADQCAKR
jgi:hypothetical protein